MEESDPEIIDIPNQNNDCQSEQLDNSSEDDGENPLPDKNQKEAEQ